MEKTELELVLEEMHDQMEQTQSKMEKVHQGDNHFFIGREREQAWFKEALIKRDSAAIVDLHGIAGIGKSFLLQRFRQMAIKENAFFLLLECSSFKSTSEQLLEKLSSSMGIVFDNAEHLLVESLEMLNLLASRRKIVLVFDSYEQIVGLEEWLQKEFISQLDERILIIFSGRRPLSSLWYTSPGWRKLILPMSLREFDYQQTNSYLEKHGYTRKETLRKMWRRTDGHPLYLSIVAHAGLYHFDEQTEAYHFKQLLDHWLEEVENSPLRKLIEPISLLRQFDTDVLTYVTQTKINNAQFQRLTQVSFIHLEKTGWSMHPLLRKAVSLLLQKSSPEQYVIWNNRIAQYYYEKIINSRNIAERPWLFNLFMNHIESKGGQGRIFSYFPDDSFRCAEVEAKNIVHTLHHLQFKEEKQKKSSSFANKHDLDQELSINIRYDKMIVLNNEAGKVVGTVLLTAVQEESLSYLQEQTKLPLFQENSFKKKYLIRGNSKAKEEDGKIPLGWYIRFITINHPYDYRARAALIYYLLPYLLRSSFCMFTTSYLAEQQILEQFGFEAYVDPEAGQVEQELRSKTFILALAEKGFPLYLAELAKGVGFTLEYDIFQRLSKREKEVAQLVIEGYSNQQISGKLSVSLVTVKKHVGQILLKNEVSNRMQLLQKNLSSYN